MDSSLVEQDCDTHGVGPGLRPMKSKLKPNYVRDYLHICDLSCTVRVCFSVFAPISLKLRATQCKVLCHLA